MNRFYNLATDALIHHDAIIDKLVGDQVMALFVPGFAGRKYVQTMIGAAEQIMHSVGYGTRGGAWLSLGVGLDAGIAYVGNVGWGEVKDFTALGDAVNIAARLQAHAGPGQIVMSERVYESRPKRHAEVPLVQLDLKGKAVPVRARVIDLANTRENSN